MSKEEKKSCRDCAYLQSYAWGFGNRNGSFTSHGFSNCRANGSSIEENELDTKSCDKFLRKKEGMTLEQQIEEQKQEETKKQQLAEQARLKKEHDRLRNRLRRNWYYVSALTIALIGLIIAIWKLILGN
jgi:hypothetical protein